MKRKVKMSILLKQFILIKMDIFTFLFKYVITCTYLTNIFGYIYIQHQTLILMKGSAL